MGSTATGNDWLTYANALSGVRLLLIAPSVYCVLHGQVAAAAALFVCAVATDFADGIVARRRGEASALGGLIDHSSDAAYVSALLAALAFHDVVPKLLPVLVIAAFVQYVLDSRALRGMTLRTSRLGRWNGIAYFAVAGTAVIRDGLGLGFPPTVWITAAGWLLVATTLVSMADRLRATLRSR